MLAIAPICVPGAGEPDWLLVQLQHPMVSPWELRNLFQVIMGMKFLRVSPKELGTPICSSVRPEVSNVWPVGTAEHLFDGRFPGQ